MKKCSCCQEMKEAHDFPRSSASADGLFHRCKACKSAAAKAYYSNNSDIIKAKVSSYRSANPGKAAEAKRISRHKKLDEYKARERAYYQKNKERVISRAAEYSSKNPERKAATNARYVRTRMAIDPVFRLTYAIRCRLGQAFRSKSIPKRGRTRDMIGCGWDQLKAHIEAKFLPGMSWENREAWHIDHMTPLSSASTVEDMERLCHYTNLQPLWASDNIRKGARMVA